MKQLKLSNKIGVLGEDLAIKYLISKNHTIICRNYLQNSGEIDIISKKEGVLHFTEVKSVSCENLEQIDSLKFNPEDSVHPKKLQRLYRTIELYLRVENISHETLWQINVLSIFINQNSKEAKVRPLYNITC